MLFDVVARKFVENYKENIYKNFSIKAFLEFPLDGLNCAIIGITQPQKTSNLIKPFLKNLNLTTSTDTHHN